MERFRIDHRGLTETSGHESLAFELLDINVCDEELRFELKRFGANPQMAVFGKMLVDPESLRMLVFGLALVLVMRFKPAGLWPSPERQRELQETGK